jgi:hypothetical protein
VTKKTMSNDPLYTAEQIRIPPQLPEILKQFTKAAIKTQPTDIVLWAHQSVVRRPCLHSPSSRYFDALANNKAPPVKARVVIAPTEVRPTSAPSLCRVLLLSVLVVGCIAPLSSLLHFETSPLLGVRLL